MQLRGQPACAQMADAAHEAGIQMRAPEQAAERWSSDRRSRSRVARAMARRIASSTPAARSSSTQNARHRRAGADRGAGRAAAALASASRQRAHAAHGLRQRRHRPPSTRAARRYSSVSTVPGERGPKFVPSTASKPSAPLQRRRLEMLLEQIVDVHAADAQQFAHVAPPEPAHLPASRSSAEAIRPADRCPAAAARCDEHGRERRRRSARMRARVGCDRPPRRPRRAPALAEPVKVRRAARRQRRGRHALGRPSCRPCAASQARCIRSRAASGAAGARRPRRGIPARIRASPRRRRPASAASSTSTERPARAR